MSETRDEMLREHGRVLQLIASGEAFRQQRFAEDDDADYFLRAQRAVQKLAADALTGSVYVAAPVQAEGMREALERIAALDAWIGRQMKEPAHE